jgi:hypothetical protein
LIFRNEEKSFCQNMRSREFGVISNNFLRKIESNDSNSPSGVQTLLDLYAEQPICLSNSNDGYVTPISIGFPNTSSTTSVIFQNILSSNSNRTQNFSSNDSAQNTSSTAPLLEMNLKNG